MTLHPASQILVWCLLVMIAQGLAPLPLLALAAGVILLSLRLAGHKFLQLLRRTRWIMFSLFLIYAWTTPGAGFLPAWGVLSPTREGMEDGVLQLSRLLIALSGLALLLDRLHRQQLIAGLYALLRPARRLGLSPERVAVRLALTLHYAEVAMLRSKDGWRATLNGLLEPHETATRELSMPLPRFAWQDGAVLLVLSLMLAWVWR